MFLAPDDTWALALLIPPYPLKEPPEIVAAATALLEKIEPRWDAAYAAAKENSDVVGACKNRRGTSGRGSVVCLQDQAIYPATMAQALRGAAAGDSVHHLDPNPLLLPPLGLVLARLLHGRARRNLRHADVPPGVARRPGVGVGLHHDDRGAVGGLRPADARPRGRSGSRPCASARPSRRRARRNPRRPC